MKSILFITAFPPNQKTAGQYYTLRLLQDLVSKGYKVDVYYFDYAGHVCEFQGTSFKVEFSLKNYLENFSYFPLYTKRFNKYILKYLQSISGNYNMLYFDFSQVHIYSLFIKHPCKVLMCHDIIAQKAKRQWPAFYQWVKHCEEKLLKSGTILLTFSKKDCDIIKNLYGLESIMINFYLKTVHVLDSITVEKNLFCFYGAWNRTENTEALIWFIENVIPYLNTNIQFNIIGGGMDKGLQVKLKNYKNFKYLGFVDSPTDEILKCQALIAPLHDGAGVKVKVIDALSTGTKVIGTEVAFEGIEDNQNNILFYKTTEANEYVEILENWESVSFIEKKNSREEFIKRYNINHFPDLIDKIF